MFCVLPKVDGVPEPGQVHVWVPRVEESGDELIAHREVPGHVSLG